MDNNKAVDFFRKSIHNKNVIFVGAGAINKNKKIGKWIDSFDTVIKTNGSLFLQNQEDFKRDFGSKIDLLYVNNQFIREMHPIDKNYMLSTGLKGIGFKTGLGKRAKYYQDTFFVRGFNDTIEQVSKIIGNKGLMTGALIYQDIINFEPKYFYATGIDFAYQKPREFVPDDFSEYVNGYLPQKIINQANEREIGKLFNHSRYKMAVLFKYFYDNNQIDTHQDVLEIMKYIIENKNFYDV